MCGIRPSDQKRMRVPNYRWGDNGQGSCGILLFLPPAPRLTGHERENTVIIR